MRQDIIPSTASVEIVKVKSGFEDCVTIDHLFSPSKWDSFVPLFHILASP